jgi:hypothetical protein
MFPKYGFAIGLFLVTLAALIARTRYLSQDYFSPDEPVALAVVDHLKYPSQWDSNWLTCKAPAPYNYDQFTFSSYHYSLYFWDKITAVFTSDKIIRLRLLNALLGGLTVICVSLTAQKLTNGLGGIAAGLAICLNPTLIQDAHYIRCESFLTAGAATIAYLASNQSHKSWACALSGFTLGILIACKVSALFLAPILLLFLLNSNETSSYWRKWLLLATGLFAGFTIGAPSALAQPELYIKGLIELRRQYASILPPHTTLSLTPSFSRAIEYYWQTLGLGICIFSTAGIFSLAQDRHTRAHAICASITTTLALWAFGREAAFIERSYSPFLPLLAIAYACGLSTLLPLLRGKLGQNRALSNAVFWLATVCTLAIPTAHSFKIIEWCFSGKECNEHLRLTREMKKQHPEADTHLVHCCDRSAFLDCYNKINHQRNPVILVIADFHDEGTAENIRGLTANRDWDLLQVRESLWPRLPTCTLHTFFSARLWVILFKPETTSLDSAMNQTTPPHAFSQ